MKPNCQNFSLKQKKPKLKSLSVHFRELHYGTTHWRVTALTNNALWTNCTQGHALTVFGNDSRKKGRHPQESVHSVSFTDTQLRGLRHLFLKVSWNLHAFPNTPDSVLVSLEFQKQCARQGSGLWKGTVSAEKALQGLETEMRGLLNKGEMRGLF